MRPAVPALLLAASSMLVAACGPGRVELIDPSQQTVPTTPVPAPDEIEALGPVGLPANILDPFIAERYLNKMRDEAPSSGIVPSCNGDDPTLDEIELHQFLALMKRSVVIPQGTRTLTITMGFVPGHELTEVDADRLVEAMGGYEQCQRALEEAYIKTATSAPMTALPDGVTAGAYWTADAPTSDVVAALLSLRGRIVMTIKLDDSRPLSVGDLDAHIADVVARLPRFDESIALCFDTPDAPALGRCSGANLW